MLKRILLIEDESTIADNVIYALETEGFHVEWQMLGHTALHTLKQSDIDLIILDVGLPDCSGFELCKTIRKFSEVPIIFLTARAEEIDRIVGLEIGGDDYVTKPFSPRELSARVKVILKRSTKAQSETQRIETDFVIDCAKTMIYYHGIGLNLTRYEYLILKTLLEKPQQVFSRERLIELVWIEPEASFDRTVDTHIKTLRAKLRDIDATDPIKTHRGFGYSIDASCKQQSNGD